MGDVVPWLLTARSIIMSKVVTYCDNCMDTPDMVLKLKKDDYEAYENADIKYFRELRKGNK